MQLQDSSLCGHGNDSAAAACLRSPTLQHEESDHPVQVDVLVLPLQERRSPGEAAQDVIDHLGPRSGHCGKQRQRRGQLEPRCTHVVTRIDPVWRLRDRQTGTWRGAGDEQGRPGAKTDVTSEVLLLVQYIAFLYCTVIRTI